MLAKVAEHVLQHVGVTRSGRELLQRSHECEFVVVADVVARNLLCVGDESAELAVRLRRMRHKHELMHRVKLDQAAERPSRREKRTKPAIREDSLDKVFAQMRIVQ